MEISNEDLLATPVKQLEIIYKIIDKSTCDDECDIDTPFIKCPECELAHGVDYATGDITQALREYKNRQ